MNEQISPLVSIGMPAYNVAPYIEKSIISVLAQTYQNLELLVVDDCGTDNTIEIVERIKNTHLRGSCIKILRQSHNMGPGEARNRTIEEAHGKYLYFLDSDDYIEPETINLMVQQAEDNHTDLVMASGRGSNICTGETYPIFTYSSYQILTGKDTFAHFVCRDLRCHVPDTIWNILFSLEFLREKDLKFYARKDEDALFLSDYYSEVEKAVLMPDVTYTYVGRPGSIMGNQARSVIPIVEIRDRFKTDEVMTQRCARLKSRSFYDVHCSRVIKHKFRAVCVSLRHFNKFSERLQYREIRQEMKHPAAFSEIIKFKRYRMFNLFFYLLSKLPSVIFVGVSYVIGKLMRWI